MLVLQIGGEDFSDFVSGMKIRYETLVANDGTRNAAGDKVADVVGEKISLSCSFISLNEQKMEQLLSKISGYEADVTFLSARPEGVDADDKPVKLKTIHAFVSAPEPAYYRATKGGIRYQPFEATFTEF